MTERFDERMLARYVAGECTEAEDAKIRAWVAADPARDALLRSYAQLWESTGPAGESWDVDAGWSRLVEARGRRASRAPAHPRTRGWWMDRRVLQAAAVLLLLLVPAVLWRVASRPSAAPAPAGAFTEVATVTGQRTTVRLPEGSVVTLAPESRIGYRISPEGREVRLEGEAYFQVEPDRDRPFVVHGGGATTRVLGTEFGMRAYADEPEVRVAVVEGRVALHARAAGRAVAELTAGEIARVTAGGELSEASVGDVSAYVSWTHGELRFSRAPAGEVLRTLGRWYDVEFVLPAGPLAVEPLTISFRNEGLDDVLAVLANALDVRFVRRGRIVEVVTPR